MDLSDYTSASKRKRAPERMIIHASRSAIERVLSSYESLRMILW
jgi:hypothetical protein